MTRAKDISKILTDADISGTLDVSGAFTSQGIDDNADATAITIDSSENIGIGTSSPSDKFHVDGAGAFIRVNRTDGEAGITLMYNGSNSTRSNITNDTSGNLTFDTANTERMRIDSVGRVMIAETSNSGYSNNADDLIVGDNGSSTERGISFGSTLASTIRFNDGSDAGIIEYVHSNNSMRFGTNDGSERMRIDSSGNLGLNTAGSTGRATGIGMEILHVGSDTDATLRLTGENGSSAETFSEITHVGASRHMNFKHNGATRIQIDANGGVLVDGGSVGTVSDSRVKKDVEDLSDGLSIVKQLRPVKFKYKGNTEYYNGDDKIYQGFIADEVQAVAPQYITEVTNKIYDDEFDGSNIVDFDEELKDKKFTSVDDFKTMSQTDLIPMLVKAIQELEARITTLEGA